MILNNEIRNYLNNYIKFALSKSKQPDCWHLYGVPKLNGFNFFFFFIETASTQILFFKLSNNLRVCLTIILENIFNIFNA